MFSNKLLFKKIIISVLIIVFLCCIIIGAYIEQIVFPRGAEVLHSYAESNMFEILNSTASYVLNKNNINSEDILNVKYNKNGLVSAVVMNTTLVNEIKSEVSLIVSDKLSKQDNNPVYVPIGSFSDNMYFIGKGPEIEFMLVQRGCILTDFEYEIKDAGINQSLYSLKITIDADVALMLPFYSANTKIRTSVMLAQLIINGECPNQILKIKENEVVDDG